jgi:hypothetical protein
MPRFDPTISIDVEMDVKCSACGKLLDFEAEQSEETGKVVLKVEPCVFCQDTAIEGYLERKGIK